MIPCAGKRPSSSPTTSWLATPTVEQLNVAEINHEELFRIAAHFAGDFLMTYDHEGELQELAEQYGFETELVAMKNAHHAEMTEMLIGRNLDWARQTRTV